MNASTQWSFDVISRWVFAGMASAAGFYLLTEHGAHLYGWLPYLLLAACPLMHVFHRHHRHHSGKQTEPPTNQQ